MKKKLVKVLLPQNITMMKYYPQNQALKGNCKDYMYYKLIHRQILFVCNR